MTITRQQRNLETNEARPTSTGPSERSKLLTTCQALFAKDLTEEESAFWAKFLSPIPIGLLRSAFDQWNRTGRFFPKPKEINDLVDQFKSNNTTKFRACGVGTCMDGWVRVFTGMTTGSEEGSLPVDSKVGAVKRCNCWYEWAGRAK